MKFKNSKFFPMLLGMLVGALLVGTVSVAADMVIYKTPSKVIVDGEEVSVEAYNIDGYNYFKLRDLASATDFGVWFDEKNDIVNIETDKGYDANYKGPDNIPKATDDSTYYNGYLGFSFEMPKGYFITEIYNENLETTLGSTNNVANLNMDSFAGYHYIGLIEFNNMDESQRASSEYIEFDMFADKDETITTLAAYMKDYEEYMLSDDEDYDKYVLEKSYNTQIAGKTFEVRVYNVRPDEDPYKHITLSCEAKNGFFLTAEATYWPENAPVEQWIIDLLKSNLKLN